MVRSGMRRLIRAVRSVARPPQESAPAPAGGLASDLAGLFPDGASIVFDVGAYKGEFAQLIHVVFPAARVWCFEPFTESYEGLRARFAGATWVSVHNLAFSDRSGMAELIIGEDQSTNSILSPVMKDGAFESDRPRVPVRLETLTTSAGQMLTGDPEISILKVDTEGNDLAVLEGAEDLLRRRRIEAVHVEVMFLEHFKGAAGFLDIARYLDQFGYRLYSLYDLKKNRQGQLRYGNALFLSPHRQTFAGVAR